MAGEEREDYEGEWAEEAKRFRADVEPTTQGGGVPVVPQTQHHQPLHTPRSP